MTLTLPIYKGRKVVKTYTADSLCVSFGTVEDIIGALHLDSVRTEKEIGFAVLGALGQLKPLLRDIFDGLTDAEIRCTHIDDLVRIFTDMFLYAADTLKSISDTVKKTTQET